MSSDDWEPVSPPGGRDANAPGQRALLATFASAAPPYGCPRRSFLDAKTLCKSAKKKNLAGSPIHVPQLSFALRC